MPNIPTFNNTKPLGDAPAPVLDRERRPTVDNSGVIAATGALGKIKSPLLPEGLADNSGLMAIGKAVQQGGNVVQALAIKRQEAETDVQVATADGAMQQERAKFEQWKQETNADPATWQEEWGNRVNQLRTNIFSNEKLTGGAQEQIGLRMLRYEKQSEADVMAGAARETFGRARAATIGIADNAAETQDKTRHEEAVSTGLAKGYLYPHEAEAMRLHFEKVGQQKAKQATAEADRREVEYETARAIADPIKWKEENKEPWKGRELVWQKARNAADERENEGASDIAKQLNAAIISGALSTPSEIDAWESPFKTAKVAEDAKHYLATRNDFIERQDREENGVENAVRLRQQIADLDPTSDKDREKLFQIQTEISTRVPEGSRSFLEADLRAKYAPKTSPITKDLVEDTLRTYFDGKTGVIPFKTKEYRTEKYTKDDSSFFGSQKYKAGDVKMGPDGKPVQVFDRTGNALFEWKTDPEAQRQAIRAETVVRQKVEEWRTANPDKANDPTEVQKVIQKALPEGTRLRALDSMGGFLKPKTDTKPQAMNTGELNDNLINTVKQLEGFEPKAFGDYKQLSIGYGTRAKHDGETITREEADQRLRQELTMHAERVDKAAAKVGANLTEGQRNALISFDFNTGQGAELLTSSNGDLKEIARRMPLYIKAGGKTNDGLVNRRKAEMQLFNS